MNTSRVIRRSVEKIPITNEELAMLRDVKAKSTRVTGWYPHHTEVRGPFCRWFTFVKWFFGRRIRCSSVEPQYQHHVANIADDCEFAACAMNYLEPLLDLVDELKKKNEELEKICFFSAH